MNNIMRASSQWIQIPPIGKKDDSKQEMPPVFNENNEEKKGMKKPKKPIYKRWWFILLVIIVALRVVVPIVRDTKKTLDWSTIVLKEYLPDPPSNKGEINENSDEKLSVDLEKVTDEQYNKYVKDCVKMGFKIDADKSSYTYEAYNSDGYSLKLTHISDELDITLETSMKMSTITWPSGAAGSVVPSPKSLTGKFNYEHDNSFSVYIGETSKTDYDEYVTTCTNSGFNIDYDKGEKYYRAYNADGYYLSISYEGNNIMLVSVSKKEKKETTNQDSSSTSESEDSSTDNNDSTIGADGMHTDFKEAMDSYETFMNEYCDFIEKYNANPSDTTLLADYATYMSKYAEFSDKFDKLGERDLNDAETAYYIQVQARVTTRLAQVDQ